MKKVKVEPIPSKDLKANRYDLLMGLFGRGSFDVLVDTLEFFLTDPIEDDREVESVWDQFRG